MEGTERKIPHGLVETVAEGDNQGKFELLIGVCVSVRKQCVAMRS